MSSKACAADEGREQQGCRGGEPLGTGGLQAAAAAAAGTAVPAAIPQAQQCSFRGHAALQRGNTGSRHPPALSDTHLWPPNGFSAPTGARPLCLFPRLPAGKLVLVGLPPEPSKVPAFALTSREAEGRALELAACESSTRPACDAAACRASGPRPSCAARTASALTHPWPPRAGRRSVAGSGIGSIEETQASAAPAQSINQPITFKVHGEPAEAAAPAAWVVVSPCTAKSRPVGGGQLRWNSFRAPTELPPLPTAVLLLSRRCLMLNPPPRPPPAPPRPPPHPTPPHPLRAPALFPEQEMLDFCGKHGITCEIELIQADYVNQAMVGAGGGGGGGRCLPGGRPAHGAVACLRAWVGGGGGVKYVLTTCLLKLPHCRPVEHEALASSFLPAGDARLLRPARHVAAACLLGGCPPPLLVLSCMSAVRPPCQTGAGLDAQRHQAGGAGMGS